MITEAVCLAVGCKTIDILIYQTNQIFVILYVLSIMRKLTFLLDYSLINNSNLKIIYDHYFFNSNFDKMITKEIACLNLDILMIHQID